MAKEDILSLHSGYNPVKEAERYIESLSLNGNIRFFILIEPGLGYITRPIKKRFPGARIIALHAGEYTGIQGEEKPEAEWFPGNGITVQDFLESEIPDTDASEIRIIEWRPALSVYGSAYLTLMEEAAGFIKRADAGFRTTKAFGRIWFKNFFKNLKIIRNLIYPNPFSLPLVVTGAGPGLEESIPLIKKEYHKSPFFILSVSSSVEALKAENIIPHMVISTDGGGWARFHLLTVFRNGKTSGHETFQSNLYRPEVLSGACQSLLTAAMTAALPSQTEAIPFLPLSDGSLWQTLILKGLGIPFIPIPQRGTVSASALDLAFILSGGNIFIAGMDLRNKDIQSHARPYGLDRFLEEKEGRMNPYYSETYRRSSLLNAGGSFGIYASWFNKQLSAYPKRLYSLGPNNSLFGSLAPYSTETFRNSGSLQMPDFKTTALETDQNIHHKAIDILEAALMEKTVLPAAKEKLLEELTLLLFPGNKNVSKGEAIDTILSMARLHNG